MCNPRWRRKAKEVGLENCRLLCSLRTMQQSLWGDEPRLCNSGVLCLPGMGLPCATPSAPFSVIVWEQPWHKPGYEFQSTAAEALGQVHSLWKRSLRHILTAATCLLCSCAFRNLKYWFLLYELVTEVKGASWIKVLAQSSDLLHLEAETSTTYTAVPSNILMASLIENIFSAY